jgi:hypothetical protein
MRPHTQRIVCISGREARPIPPARLNGDCPADNCPAVYTTDQGGSLLVRGYDDVDPCGSPLDRAAPGQ